MRRRRIRSSWVTRLVLVARVTDSELACRPWWSEAGVKRAVMFVCAESSFVEGGKRTGAETA